MQMARQGSDRLLQAPAPVAAGRAWSVEAGPIVQPHQVLQGNHHQLGTGRQGQLRQLPTGGNDHISQQLAHLAPLVLLQPLPPAVGGGVVMGSRVHHPAMPLVVGRQVAVIRVAIKGKLQDLHPWQFEPIAQVLHLLGDHAQVLGDQGQPAIALQQMAAAASPVQQPQQPGSWRRHPMAVLGGGIPPWHAPVGLQGAEVVEAQQVE